MYVCRWRVRIKKKCETPTNQSVNCTLSYQTRTKNLTVLGFSKSGNKFGKCLHMQTAGLFWETFSWLCGLVDYTPIHTKLSTHCSHSAFWLFLFPWNKVKQGPPRAGKTRRKKERQSGGVSWKEKEDEKKAISFFSVVCFPPLQVQGGNKAFHPIPPVLFSELRTNQLLAFTRPNFVVEI